MIGRIFLYLFIAGRIMGYTNTVVLYEVFTGSYTQEQIDFNISSATESTDGMTEPPQLARYSEANGKMFIMGDEIISNLSIFQDIERTKFWCSIGFDENGYINDSNFDIYIEAFKYQAKSTYTIHHDTPTIGEDYVIDGDTYTAINSTWTIGGSTFIIEGQEYTVSTNTVSTNTVHVVGAKQTGFWATGIGGIIAIVWGWRVYFFKKKKEDEE